MKERIMVMFIVYTLFLGYELLHRSAAPAWKDRFFYIILLLSSVYLSLDFIMNRDWPDTYDFIPSFIKKLAQQIDSFLNVKMS